MLGFRSRRVTAFLALAQATLAASCAGLPTTKSRTVVPQPGCQDPKLILESHETEEMAFAPVLFRDAVKLGSEINTEYNEYYPYLSPDGKNLYFSSDRPGGMGAEDLYVAEKVNGIWQEPKNLGPVVNSQATDTGPMLSYGRTYLFFWSAREESPRTKLFVSKIVDGEYQPPVPLPDFINLAIHTDDPFLSADGKALYFETCKRPGNFGKRDLWRSDIVDGVFCPPVNLGRQINRLYRQKCPSLTADGQYLCYLVEHSVGDARIFLSESVGGEHQKPREVRLNLPKPPADTGQPIPQGELNECAPKDPEIVLSPHPAGSANSKYPFGYIDSAKISWDGQMLFFSMKTENYDIWYAERR